MRLNFKKISAIATSALMIGMSMGVAAAANYPAPFVEGGAANVAIVYGTGAGMSYLDIVEAGNIQADLQAKLGGGTGGTSDTTTGEIVSLDTGSTKIWLNSSLNIAKSTLTKTDLPTVLADTTFSGNVDAKLTQTIKILGGDAAGAEHSSKIWFGKQPTSTDDPELGISIGSSSYPLYNATATMKAINFTSADSEGEDIILFGQSFTVAAETDTSEIVLLKEAERVSLDTDNPSGTVTVGGATYTIELVSASDTAATIKVTDSNGASTTKEVNEAASKKIQGLEVAVINADETNLKLSATVIAGADKITLQSGQTALKGSDDDPIEGTKVYLAGGTGACTGITIEVFRPSDPDLDAIIPSTPFVDPVFGSFKIDFQGVSSPLEDTNRETITIKNSGDDKMSLTMTDSNNYEKTFEFGYNNSGTFNLSDGSNHKIRVREMANLSLYDMTILGIDDYGRLIEVTQLTNATSGSSAYANDIVKVKDVISGETIQAVIASEGSGTLSIDGKTYTVTYGYNSGENGWVEFKYPTSDSLATSGMVIYPTIQTKNGAKLALVEPFEVDLSNFDGAGNDVTKLYFPDGDGWGSAITVSFTPQADGSTNWTINSVVMSNLTAQNNVINITVGDVSYFIRRPAGATNKTIIGVKNITGESTQIVDSAAAVLAGTSQARPGILIFDGKDDDNNYKAVYVDLEQGSAGNSNNGVGVNDIYFSSKGKAYYTATKYSNSDIEQELDWYGTLVTSDADDSDQKFVTISYPDSQAYGKVYLGEIAAAVTAGTSGSTGSATPLGDVKIKDTEVSSASAKNLIIIGGSCINSAAATLVGGQLCGEEWKTATNVGAGEFLIKGYATNTLAPGKLALLVAGYNFEDTVNAAKYLRTQTVQTDKEYKGTSSTTATLVTTTP